MQLKLVSKRENDPNNELYLNSTEFFMKFLLKKDTYSHVERFYIKVEAVMGYWGECSIRNLKNDNITVRIKFKHSLNFIESLTTIAHECVHAKQFITGELKIHRYNGWYWKGKSYGNDPYINDASYVKLPWEKEAYRKQESLVKKYLDHYYLQN